MIGIVRGEVEEGCGGAWEVDAVGWRCCDCGDAAPTAPAATNVVVAGLFWCLRVGGLSSEYSMFHSEYMDDEWVKWVRWMGMDIPS